MNHRLVIGFGLVVLIVLVALGLRSCAGPKTIVRPMPNPSVVVSVSTPSVTGSHPSLMVSTPTAALAKPLKTAAKTKAVPTTSTGAPIAPKVDLHTELIPKDISIVRCYYSQQITPPGATFQFDINGSGFTSDFQKMISVDSNATDIRFENLKLVTANQIHGDIVVGPKATTTFVYPRVLIKNLPVFSAPDPFAVVRPGEVLTIIFISMEENGRGGRFRVLTNLDEEQLKQFQVLPSTPLLQISDLEAHLPFVVEGSLHIGPGLGTGAYGLSTTLSSKEIFRHDGMIRIVRPNVGRSGFAQGLAAAEPFHRPGDDIQIYLQGTGLMPGDVIQLNAKVDEFDMGHATFSFISPVQGRIAFLAPATTPPGKYGVSVMDPSGQVIFQKKDVFQIVPANWVVAVQVMPPPKPGSKNTLRILGRDFSADFAASLKIDTDETGVHIQNVHTATPTEIDADLTVEASVAPGDYWLHLSSKGQKIVPPYGSLIKIDAP